MSLDELVPRMADEKEAADAIETMHMLADQVGIKCADCGTLLRGRHNVAYSTYMTPIGQDAFQTKGYCGKCTAAMAHSIEDLAATRH